MELEKPVVNDNRFLFGTKPFEIFYASSLVDEKSEDPDYCAELKINGWRLGLVSDIHGKVTGYQGRGEKMSFFSISDDFRLEPCSQLEGEWVDRRTNQKNQIYWFNLLRYRGEITGFEDKYRRKLLEEMFPEETKVGEFSMRVVPRFYSDFRQVYEQYRDNDLIEGLVIKKLSAPLEYSFDKLRKSPSTIKVKK